MAISVTAQASQVVVGTTPVLLAPANADRKQLLVFGPAFVGGGNVTATTGFLAEFGSGINLEDDAAKAALFGVANSPGNTVYVLELVAG